MGITMSNIKLTEEEKRKKRNEAAARYRERNREKVNERQRLYSSTPEAKEKHRLRMLEWRKKNPEKALEISRKCYKKNADKYNENRRCRYKVDHEYRQKRIDAEKKYKASGRRNEVNRLNPKSRERSKNYRMDNPDKVRNKMKEYRHRVWNKHEMEQRNTLENAYVVKLIKKQTNYSLKTEEISKELIDIKKQSMKLKRELKKIKQ